MLLALLVGTSLLVISCSTVSKKARSETNTRPESSTKSEPAATFTGKVISIEDGDTIVVVDDLLATHKIRLKGIDAPEHGQAFADRSRVSLSDEVYQKNVTIEWSKRDRYGRIVGKLLSSGRDVCLEQVRVGMAWHYKYFQNEQTEEERRLYSASEVEAKRNRVGLWVDENPTPPWNFRRRR